MIAAIPARDVLRAALFKRRHKEAVRILIVVACLSTCRRGRSAMSYTLCKLASPVTFLLWCLGTARRRRGGNNLLQPGRNPHQRQRRGWREVIGVTRARIGSGDCTAREFPEHEEAAGSAIIRLAALGEGGRLAAFEKLRELQREGACCDVTLSVGESHFKAHKCVLAAQSFPLRAMFEGAFKEGSESVITLRDVDPSGFALLLDFLYDRDVEVTADNVEALLDLSARYGVSLLRRHCCAFLARSASPSNACSLLAVADRYDCHRLRRDLLAYTLECFPLACCEGGAEDFCHLSLALVAEVLMDDRLEAGEAGEVTVFWAAVSWLEAERSRRRDADEVLSHVRFGLISAKTLAEAVEAHALLQARAGKAFVHEAYRYQALPPESLNEFCSSMGARARPRSAGAADAGAGTLSVASTGGRFPSASERCGSGRWRGRFREAGLDCKEFSGDGDGEGSEDGEKGVDAKAGTGRGGWRRGGEGGGDGAREAASSVGRGQEEEEEGEEEGEGKGGVALFKQEEGEKEEPGGGQSSKKSPVIITDAGRSPARRSWGVGLRMYV